MIRIDVDVAKLASVSRTKFRGVKGETPLPYAPKKERKNIFYSFRELSEFIGCSITDEENQKNEERIPNQLEERNVISDPAEVLISTKQGNKKR